MRPEQLPIGLALTRTARVVGRAFDEALASAGGSLPVWLVLLNLRIRKDSNQRQLAEAVGVSEATLTHHLNAMEREGLLERRRDPSNRRNHIVELTAPGEAAFARLVAVAVAFDRQLHAGLDEEAVGTLRTVLDQLATNVGSDGSGPPWAGLVEAGSRASRRSRAVPARDPEPPS